ncbi:MAG: hypothetical protein MUF54_02245 [Polyangiaceae bacterium]|jgi:hypothetical protein|nr:hypothetical protein [Polyangiaceae bacterium]
MKIRRRRLALCAGLRVALAALALPACQPANANSARPANASALEPWEGVDKELFDDSIDLAAAGFADPARAAGDPKLRQRAKRAEFILRVRVRSVTIHGTDTNARYLIALRTLGDPVFGPRPPSDDITLTITAASPAFGVARAMDLRFSGRTVVAILRRFHQANEQALHWHLTADSPEVHDVLRRARLAADVAERHADP